MISPASDIPGPVYGAVSIVPDRRKLADAPPQLLTEAWPYGVKTRPEVLTAPPSVASILHALRRRFWLAIGIGIPVAILFAALVWKLVPIESRAFAILEVENKVSRVLMNEQRDLDFDAFKANQQAKVKSRDIISDAVRGQEISQLATIREHGSGAVQWLTDTLEVSYPGKADYLEIALSGERTSDLDKIVNAVAKSFVRRVAEDELAEYDAKFTTLKELYERNESDIRENEKNIYTYDEASRSQIEMQQKLDEREALSKRRADLTRDLSDVEMKIEVLDTIKDRPDVAAFMKQEPERAVQADVEVQQTEAALAQLRQRLENAEQTLRNKSDRRITNLNEQISLTEKKLEQRKDEARKKLQATGVVDLGDGSVNIEVLKLEKKILEGKIKDVAKEIAAKKLELEASNKSSEAVVVYKAKSIQLHELNHKIGADMATLKAERDAAEARIPDKAGQIPSSQRVKLLQLAEEPENNNRRTKYLLTLLCGMVGFGLVVTSVTAYEFTSRRVNCPSEVSDGLGLRVLGTLPGLSSWSWLGKSNEKLQVAMAESVDGIRTTVMHLATSSRHQLILVTSAVEGEGKTTIATQLAASFARLGKKTLFVDGDMRSPSGHEVFGLPNEAGLCEVLRGQTEPEEVIRRAESDHLFVLTAGQCDPASIYSLAKESTVELFEHLKNSFDFVILDSPPVLSVTDALLQGQVADGVLISVLRDSSSVRDVYQATERLQSVGANVLGSVVNGVQDRSCKYRGLAMTR